MVKSHWTKKNPKKLLNPVNDDNAGCQNTFDPFPGTAAKPTSMLTSHLITSLKVTGSTPSFADSIGKPTVFICSHLEYSWANQPVPASSHTSLCERLRSHTDAEPSDPGPTLSRYPSRITCEPSCSIRDVEPSGVAVVSSTQS